MINIASKLFIIALLSASCVPFPKYLNITPVISGKITYKDKPVSGVNVYLSGNNDKNCTNRYKVTKTNNMGEFYFKQEKKLFLFRSIFGGDQLLEWSVCILHNNQILHGWSDGFTGTPGHLEKKLCELDDKTRKNMVRKYYGETDLCFSV